MIVVVALFVVIVLKNLGRSLNYVFGGIILITNLAILIQDAISLGTVTAESGSCAVYSVVILLLMYTKFKDKEARGRWIDDEAGLK